MHICARRFVGYPLGLPRATGDFAVERGRHFGGNQRAVGGDPVIEDQVQVRAFPFQNARNDLDARRPQYLKSSPRVGRIGIRRAHHHVLDPRGDDRIGACARASMG